MGCIVGYVRADFLSHGFQLFNRMRKQEEATAKGHYTRFGGSYHMSGFFWVYIEFFYTINVIYVFKPEN